jgi:hypothetical protein
MPSRSFLADTTVRQAVPYVANRTSLVITVESVSVVYDKRKALGEDPTLARYVVTSTGTATLKIEEDYVA